MQGAHSYIIQNMHIPCVVVLVQIKLKNHTGVTVHIKMSVEETQNIDWVDCVEYEAQGVLVPDTRPGHRYYIRQV